MPKNNLPFFSLSDCLFCYNRWQILINKIKIDWILSKAIFYFPGRYDIKWFSIETEIIR